MFVRGKLEDAKLCKRFLSYSRPKIKKHCVMRDHACWETLLCVTLELEGMLAKLGETPFEMLKVKHEKNMITRKIMKEKQVHLLKEFVIYLLKR